MNRMLILFFALLISGSPARSDIAAEALLSAGRVDVAITNLQAQLRSDPNDARAYSLLSRAYYSLEHWDEAVRAAQKAVALEPANSNYHMWLGRAYGEKAEHSSWFAAIGLAKKVRSEFERAVQLDNSNLRAQSDLAEFYLEAPSFLGGGKDKARAQAKRIANLNQSEAHWVLASLAEKESNWPAAEQEHQAAIRASGNQASYWLNLVSFYRRRGRLDEMENAIAQANHAQMNDGEAWVDAAELLFRSGRNFPAAAQFLQRYLSSNATVADAPTFQAHYLLGMILEKEGNKRAAADEYRAALSLASNFPPAQQALSRLQR